MDCRNKPGKIKTGQPGKGYPVKAFNCIRADNNEKKSMNFRVHRLFIFSCQMVSRSVFALLICQPSITLFFRVTILLLYDAHSAECVT